MPITSIARSFPSGGKNLGQVAVRRCTRSRENRGLHRPFTSHTSSTVSISLSPLSFALPLGAYDEYNNIKTSKNIGKRAGNYFLAITREKEPLYYTQTSYPKKLTAVLTRERVYREHANSEKAGMTYM